MVKEFNYFNEGEELKGISEHVAGVKEKSAPQNIFEAAAEVSISDAVDFAEKQIRSLAMSAAILFVEDGDFSYQALADIVSAINDMNPEDEGDGEGDDDEFNELMTAVGYAFIALGADQANVHAFIDGENNEEGAKLGGFLTSKLEETTSDDEEIITNYAVSGDMVLESMVKVIRGGKLTFKKKRIGRAKKMSSLQKASLKKARRKAFSGVAKRARLKSMKIRRKRGL